MDLKDILAISGHGGLFKYVSDGRNGIIVESFDNKKRMFVSASTKVSSLKDIAIYTETEELPVAEVLKSIFEKESGGTTIDPKSSNDELKDYMAKILPDYDRERVYVSDIKKLVTWYGILHENKLLIFDEETAEKEPSSEESKTEAAPKDLKKDSVKKSTRKPAAAGRKPSNPSTARKTTVRSVPKAAK